MWPWKSEVDGLLLHLSTKDTLSYSLHFTMAHKIHNNLNPV